LIYAQPSDVIVQHKSKRKRTIINELKVPF